MEGSWHFKDVDNYEVLAKYYDALLQDEGSLKYWLEYIHQLKGKDVLELASGSAVMAKILKNEGYNVVASDISEAMKKASKRNFDGEYLILNMIDFKLDRSFDIILCICDSINYLNEDELLPMFKNVYEHLNSGGTFLFDMHSMMRLEEFKDEYIEEGQVLDTNYQWAILADTYQKQLQERFTFYMDEGIVQEHHVQNVFDIKLVKEKMLAAGFEVEIVEDFIEDEKVLVMGVKR